MKKIEQITLSIEDINDHHANILNLDVDYPHAQALFKTVGIYDDMLERFVHTFLENYIK